MRALAPASTTPSGCNNLSTGAAAASSSRHLTADDPTSGSRQKPDSSRAKRNIRPSSLSPATRNPAVAGSCSSPSLSSPLRTASPSPGAAAVSRKPSAAQLRARATNNPTSTKAVAAAGGSAAVTPGNTRSGAATGPPTKTGPRRITATTTTLRAKGTSAQSPSHSPSHLSTKTPSSTSASTTTTPANPNTTTRSASPAPPAPDSTSTSTSTTNAAPTPSPSARHQQPTVSSSLRSPLRQQDQNVLNPSRPAPAARAKPSPSPAPSPSPTSPAFASSSSSSTPTMPPNDKGGSTTTRQPGMHSLTAKGPTRAPLTPKVAAKPSSVVTPLGRRRNENPNNKNHPTLPLHATAAGGAKDDLTSPAPFLSNNITPRSDSRQSRVNSANSTPNGTPNPGRNGDWDRQSTVSHAEPPRRQVVTFSPPSHVSNRHDATESKFFYASEATKPSQPPPQSKPPVVAAAPQRASTFMYANGSAVDKNRPTSPGVGFTPMLAPSLSPALSPAPTPPPEPQQSKFFYANGAPDLAPGFRPSSAASRAESVTSGTGRAKRISSGSAGGFSMAQRPMSPSKPAQPPTSAPLAKSNSMPHSARNSMTSPPPLVVPSHQRKVSVDTVSQVASHVGSHVASEGPATDAMIMSRFMASQSPTPSEMPSPTMGSFFPNQPITIASILQAAEELSDVSSEEDEDDESKDLEQLHSPTKPTHGDRDPLKDMVVNARRERKVQDLEITNASLEAINRSLERQLRKQTAEIRRYKRLSRSGRLSVPSTTPSRVPSDSTTGGLGIEGLDLSDLSEEEDEAADDDLDDMEDSLFESSEFSETDTGSPASPKPEAEKSNPDESNPDPSKPEENTDRDTRRRKRDEKRLQLDLTKHRELLVDSQKINQSIKRCLNWTEELIKEGKKALEYSVRPSDVKLPPRVLRPKYLEDNDEEEGQKNDASTPSSPSDSPRSLNAKWSKEPQDRDSGIELPADSS